jgi:hypothetical protein
MRDPMNVDAKSTPGRLRSVASATGCVAFAFGPTITGSGFTGAAGVSFGTTAANSFSAVSDAQVTTTAPAGTGTVDVTVTSFDPDHHRGLADQPCKRLEVASTGSPLLPHFPSRMFRGGVTRWHMP